MKRYKDWGRASGIRAYNYGMDWIHVEFKSGGVYEYTYSSAGKGSIEEMKQLADVGEGLNTFINIHVKNSYSRKIR